MSVDVTTDDGLRAALRDLAGIPIASRAQVWEAIGTQVLDHARRDARSWRRHRDDYTGAYTLAALDLLRRRPDRIAAADSPWRMVIAVSRQQAAVSMGALASGGLTGREPAGVGGAERVVPRTISLDLLREQTGYDVPAPELAAVV